MLVGVWRQRWQELGAIPVPKLAIRCSVCTISSDGMVATYQHESRTNWLSVQRSAITLTWLKRFWALIVLFCSLVVLDPRVGHTMVVLSPFISVLCHSDWLFHRESWMLSIQAVRGLPRLRVPGIVPCIISFSRQLSCFLMGFTYIKENKLVGTWESWSEQLTFRKQGSRLEKETNFDGLGLEVSGLGLEAVRDSLRSDGHCCRKCKQFPITQAWIRWIAYAHSLLQLVYLLIVTFVTRWRSKLHVVVRSL